MIIFDKNHSEKIDVLYSNMTIKRELAINIGSSETPLSREVMANGIYQAVSLRVR